MKYKTTAKELKNGYFRIIAVGYCELQALLNYESPRAYTCGVYGWNFDVYHVDGVAICTGYRGMPNKHTKADYNLIREYEAKAQDKTREERLALLSEFVKIAINNYEKTLK